MRNFVLGLFVGIGIAAAAGVYAAAVVGGNGWLVGWDVIINNSVVCSDPYVRTGVREIECE